MPSLSTDADRHRLIHASEQLDLALEQVHLGLATGAADLSAARERLFDARLCLGLCSLPLEGPLGALHEGHRALEAGGLDACALLGLAWRLGEAGLAIRRALRS